MFYALYGFDCVNSSLYQSRKRRMPPIVFLTLWLLFSSWQDRPRARFGPQRISLSKTTPLCHRAFLSITSSGRRRSNSKKQRMAPNTQAFHNIIDGIMLPHEDTRIRCALLGCGMVGCRALRSPFSFIICIPNHVFLPCHGSLFSFTICCRWDRNIFHTSWVTTMRSVSIFFVTLMNHRWRMRCQ